LNEKLLPSPAEPNEEVATTPFPDRQPAPYLTTWEPILPQQPMEAPVDSARSGLPQVPFGVTSIHRCPECGILLLERIKGKGAKMFVGKKEGDAGVARGKSVM